MANKSGGGWIGRIIGIAAGLGLVLLVIQFIPAK